LTARDDIKVMLLFQLVLLSK